MGKISEYSELMKHREGQVEMSDVLLARALVRDIGGRDNPIGVMLYEAFKKLRKMFPHDEEPHKQWTERRLKGWWNRESQNVMHWQMCEMYAAASKAKEERALVAAARKEHAEFIEKTARLRALLEHTDEAFFGDQIEGMERQFGQIGRAHV